MFTSLFLSILMSFTPMKAESIDIHEAVAKDLIKVEAISKGDYSGQCMAVVITPLKPNKYTISIPSGTHFIAENDPEQDIFVVEDQILAMTAKEEQTFSVEGFCSQHDDASPDKGSLFKMTKSKNEKLIELAKFINGKGYSEDTKQNAIWAVSDGETIAAIFEDDKEEVKELRDYVCDITERPNPWYNAVQEYRVTETRHIESSPVEILGVLEYEIKEKGKMRLSVYKSNGDLVRDLFKDVAINHTGETAFNFKGKVQGWEKGGYEVKVFINEKEIHVMPFEV